MAEEVSCLAGFTGGHGMNLSWMMILAGCAVAAGCRDNEEIFSGAYYQYTLRDSVDAVASGDPVHVLVIQAPVTAAFIDPIPVHVSDDPRLLDTVRLRLDVRYGGPSPAARPARIIRAKQDSVILWYAQASWFAGPVLERRGARPENEPKPETFQITGLEVVKSPGRSVTVASTLIW
jgi:hypothetical protein